MKQQYKFVRAVSAFVLLLGIAVAWPKPATADVIEKRCGKCNRPVPTYCQAGGTCPYCGCQWGWEERVDLGRPPSAREMMMALMIQRQMMIAQELQRQAMERELKRQERCAQLSARREADLARMRDRRQWYLDKAAEVRPPHDRQKPLGPPGTAAPKYSE